MAERLLSTPENNFQRSKATRLVDTHFLDDTTCVISSNLFFVSVIPFKLQLFFSLLVF